MDYSLFPPVNAALNSLSTVLLLAGFFLIKAGRREAHQRTMVAALVTSALFLCCYLVYHYSVGHTEFPREYPTARKIYLAILVPHIILAVVNVPLIALLVIAAFRGRFERHKRLARFTFPSWLFVSFTGVVIYFMIYVWFPPTFAAEDEAASRGAAASAVELGVSAGPPPRGENVTVIEATTRSGDLVFEPAFQAVKADAGQTIVEVAFGVYNTGREAVRIDRLESGCLCLSVEVDRNPVEPGSWSTITGIFDTEKLMGKSERRITVATSQQSRPVFLTTRIETEPLYTIDSPMTTWTVGSEPSPQTVQFRVLREAPIRVLSAQSQRPEVRCEIVEIEEGRAYDLKLVPESTESPLLGVIRLETDCEIESHARPLLYFSMQ